MAPFRDVLCIFILFPKNRHAVIFDIISLVIIYTIRLCHPLYSMHIENMNRGLAVAWKYQSRLAEPVWNLPYKLFLNLRLINPMI